MAILPNGDGAVIETEKLGVTRYDMGDTRIYRIGVESLPRHVTNVYLILDGEASLVDVGFGSEKGIEDLTRGLNVVNREFKEDVGFQDIASVVITHGHGDHFGMLEYPKLKGKKLYMHPLDTKVLMDYSGQYRDWKRHMGSLAEEAGCNVDLDQLFPSDRLDVHPGDYDLVEVSHGQKIISGYEVCHTPGHSPGHICLRVGPVLLLGDHILSVTTPHQVPASGWQGVGLDVYIASLRKAAACGAQLGLAAHEDTVYSIKRRAEEIEAFHFVRLEELLGCLAGEKNLYQLAYDYYRRHPEFTHARSVDDLVVDDKLLALEEMKAHVEYLLNDNKARVTGTQNGIVRYQAT